MIVEPEEEETNDESKENGDCIVEQLPLPAALELLNTTPHQPIELRPHSNGIMGARATKIKVCVLEEEQLEKK